MVCPKWGSSLCSKVVASLQYALGGLACLLFFPVIASFGPLSSLGCTLGNYHLRDQRLSGGL